MARVAAIALALLLAACDDDGDAGVPDGGGGADAGGGTDAGGLPRADCTTGTCHYVRAGAPPGGDGSTWSAALEDVPAMPERGAIYFVADGDYGALMLDAPESGAAVITIRKAIAADHGSDDGWDPAYGEGQASFPGVVLVSDY